jgi:ferrous iron transport protein B
MQLSMAEQSISSLPNHVTKHRHVDPLLSAGTTPHTKVALVGNPNVGKSLIFNFLSGLYVDVSNYPGTTVEFSRGTYGSFEIYDTPGVYGISSLSAEENVTRDVVLESDVVVNVVDSIHLERDLFLTLQLIDMGKKTALVLNFQDELKRQGISIDIASLSSLLGLPVYLASAANRTGLDRFDDVILSASVGRQDPMLHQRLHELLTVTGSEAEALLILEGDTDVAVHHGLHAGMERERFYVERRNRVNAIINAVLVDTSPQPVLSTLLGRWAINVWTGIPMLFVSLYLVYLFCPIDAESSISLRNVV